MKSTLLFDLHPLVVNPDLAALIGLNEAIILQQIHYWVGHNKKNSKNFHQGHYWTYNTYEEWQGQFPFWSTSTIKRTIKNLESNGYIMSSNYNSLAFDKTKWYTINYKSIEALRNQIDSHSQVERKNSYIHGGKMTQCIESEQTMDGVNIAQPIPEINSEIKSTETKQRKVEVESPPLPYR